jgi:hypothetical protein
LFTSRTCPLSLSPATCRKNKYDGVDEYYVDVKERGQREEEETKEETRKTMQKLEACSDDLSTH